MGETGMMDTDPGDDPVPLSACYSGDITVTADSTERISDVFSGLPHRWGWAQMYRGFDETGNQTEDIYLLFGLSSEEHVETAYAGDYLSLNIPIRIEGTSGSIGEFTSSTIGTSGARRQTGEYYGNGSGFWFVENVTGSWNLSSWEPGEMLTGTTTVTFNTGCATSLSTFTYSFDFALPLAGLGGELINRCDGFGGDDTDFQIGKVAVTSGSAILEDAEGNETMARLLTRADKFFLNVLDGQEAQLLVEIDEPALGQNQDSSAFYREGECTWRASSASDVNVTLMDSGSGTLLEGPTGGSFEVDLSFFPEGSSGNCDESNRTIEGTFGMAVCAEPIL
jgi:hypothetical protein